jgi:hypothetical protein
MHLSAQEKMSKRIVMRDVRSDAFDKKDLLTG